MKHLKSLVLAALMLLLIPASFAQTPSFTAGTGANESYMVVDFQDGTADPSFLFGYKYDGVKTGADMIAALGAFNSPSVGYVPGYAPSDGYVYGIAVNSFTYAGHSQAGFDSSYWSYYTKDSLSVPWDSTDYSGVGASGRTLFNGSVDGWSWDTGSDPLPRDPAPATVPEASPVLLFGLGTLGLVFVARKRKKA